jgi:hypothetical protein
MKLTMHWMLRNDLKNYREIRRMRANTEVEFLKYNIANFVLCCKELYFPLGQISRIESNQ